MERILIPWYVGRLILARKPKKKTSFSHVFLLKGFSVVVRRQIDPREETSYCYSWEKSLDDKEI